MHCSLFALVASLFAAAVVSAQGVTSAIAPSSSPPSGCSETYDGTFEITVSALTSSGKLRKRQNNLAVTLINGVLMDQDGRTGYIASNYQFQFDKPPQAGAIYTAGFSVCNNGSLALGGEAIWWECQSGSFYNLYDRDWAEHCMPILIEALGASLGPTSTEATTTAEASAAQGGSTNVATTATLQNANTENTASGSTTATPVSESSNVAIVPSTPLPSSGASATGGTVTSSTASATGSSSGNSTASSGHFSNSTTSQITSTSALTSTTSSKASSSAAAKSTSSAGVAVPLRAQDALTGLGAAILGLALL